MQNIPGHKMISFTIGFVVVLFCLWFIFGGFFKVKGTVNDAINAGGDAFSLTSIKNSFAQIADDAHYKMTETTKKAQEKFAKKLAYKEKYSKYANDSWWNPANWWGKINNKISTAQAASAGSKYDSAKASDSVFQKDKLANPYTYVKYGIAVIVVLLIIFFVWKLASRPRGTIGSMYNAPAPAPAPAPVIVNTPASSPSMYTDVSTGQLNSLCGRFGLDAGSMTSLYGSPEAALATLQRYDRKFGGDVGAIQERISEDM